jgi:excisionase family DNA binding protein
MIANTAPNGPQFFGGDALLLIPEAAKHLRVSPKTIRRMIVTGKLRSAKYCGKRLIPLGDLNGLVKSSLQ